jgi:mRNA interferase RelE/StbE
LSYDVELTPSAQKDLDEFQGQLLTKFEKLILGLYDNPRPRNSIKLVGGATKWRIRTGDYRILYEIDDQHKAVTIYRIAHRKDVYR